ncbi:hypothetical protein [Saccharopolyspora karakumensis]|uniref:hypothetical protein n=1 Tax=Saccharopolyspora karakumensis TaxID=2530386 RepID=UPI0014048B1E|nr:hypothetical protein [Saccharopolyspora karakumensis]
MPAQLIEAGLSGSDAAADLAKPVGADLGDSELAQFGDGLTRWPPALPRAEDR